MYIWEVAAWEIAHLGSCHLGKYPWEVNAWEKAFGKVPILEITVVNQWCSSLLERSLEITYAFTLTVPLRTHIKTNSTKVMYVLNNLFM